MTTERRSDLDRSRRKTFVLYGLIHTTFLARPVHRHSTGQPIALLLPVHVCFFFHFTVVWPRFCDLISTPHFLYAKYSVFPQLHVVEFEFNPSVVGIAEAIPVSFRGDLVLIVLACCPPRCGNPSKIRLSVLVTTPRSQRGQRKHLDSSLHDRLTPTFSPFNTPQSCRSVGHGAVSWTLSGGTSSSDS